MNPFHLNKTLIENATLKGIKQLLNWAWKIVNQHCT